MRKYMVKYTENSVLFRNSQTKIISSWCKIAAYLKFKKEVPAKCVIHFIHRVKPIMKHINKDFKGWFSFAGFYTDMVNRFPEGATFVEVGVYEGKSLAYLIVDMLNTNKKFHVYGVDIFPDGIKGQFNENMRPLKKHFTVMHMTSEEAASRFKDESVDFVFIDAAHDYVSVMNDINCWLPKIKHGGVIAGHDYHPSWLEVMMAVDDSFLGNFCNDYVKKQQVWVKYK